MIFKIITAILFLSCTTIVFAQTDNNADNAAIYYNKAFSLIKTNSNSPSIAQTGTVKKVLEEGWVENDPEIEGLLKENEAALIEFKKGYAIDKCDFSLGKKPDNPYGAPSANFLGARNLAALAILDARRDEHQNRIKSATNQYIRVLEFGHHLSQDKTLISKAMEISIDNWALRLIEQYLKSSTSEEIYRAKLNRYLQNLKKRMVPLSDCLIFEKEAALLSTEKGLEEEILREIESNPNLKEGASGFKDDVRAIAKETFDKYWDPYIQAAKNNSANDLEKATAQLEQLSKSGSGMDPAMETLRLLSTSSSLKKENVVKMCELINVISIPNFTKIFTPYFELDKKMSTLIELSSQAMPIKISK